MTTQPQNLFDLIAEDESAALEKTKAQIAREDADPAVVAARLASADNRAAEHDAAMKAIEKRQDIERKVVRHLIRTMKAAGWPVAYVDYGDPDDDTVSCKTENEAMDTVFSVDESTIAFRKPAFAKTPAMTCFVQIVLGNDGWDCIADYSSNEEFRAIMENEVAPFCEKLELEA